MTDEYDVFVEAEIEERLLASREEGRRRLADTFVVEVGFRAAVRTQSLVRDDRWFRGLFGMRIG